MADRTRKIESAKLNVKRFKSEARCHFNNENDANLLELEDINEEIRVDENNRIQRSLNQPVNVIAAPNEEIEMEPQNKIEIQENDLEIAEMDIEETLSEPDITTSFVETNQIQLQHILNLLTEIINKIGVVLRGQSVVGMIGNLPRGQSVVSMMNALDTKVNTLENKIGVVPNGQSLVSMMSQHFQHQEIAISKLSNNLKRSRTVRLPARVQNGQFVRYSDTNTLSDNEFESLLHSGTHKRAFREFYNLPDDGVNTICAFLDVQASDYGY